MIKVVAKGFYHEDKVEDVIRLYEELVNETRKENGCIVYSLFRDIKDPSILTMIEEWESQEALDLHMQTKHFTTIIPMVSKFRKSSELNIYEMIL